MPNVGFPEIIVVLIIALIIFGPKRLPELGRSLGKGIREFRGSIGGDHDDVEDKRRELESSGATVEPEKPVEGEVVGDSKV
jgi:sec-independent protein translocase protein TatA